MSGKEEGARGGVSSGEERRDVGNIRVGEGWCWEGRVLEVVEEEKHKREVGKR